MKRFFLVSVLSLVFATDLLASGTPINPTISPTLFHYNDQITVTYDVTGTALASLTDAWVWVWIPNTTINALYNINPATSGALPAKCTKSVVSGKTLFTITFRPSDFFGSDISAQTQMGILLKASDWSLGQTSDYLTNFLIGSNYQVKLTSPTQQPLFVTNGSQISVMATASDNSDYVLKVNGKGIDSITSVKDFSYLINVSDSVKSYKVSLLVKSGTTDTLLTFSYLIKENSPALVRPSGIIDGINYNPSDQTKATLCFWAPNKTSVYAFGDFTDWDVDPKYLMNKDGEHFWVEITGLTPGTEYAFQYLVNDTLRIADPYTDKILEQDDDKIPATTYPNLKTIPSKAISSQWYYNHFSVLQTGQTPYQWQTSGYQKPAKEKLVIYELLIRDFFDDNHRNFQSLIDTISYFKRLGVNAIELMPVAEFNGQVGWGYNPTSMFAVQKYYGHKNKLKEFVDKCHANGIAVIMDLVMNHQDLPNSYCLLDYDFVNNHPKSTNKWFNVSAPHPYSVFNDLNHASTYTRKYLDTINYYWMHEFKIDGYRYDLSKGFTQTVSTEATAGNYDASRINNLTRMADKLWLNFPDAYIILEHFAVNSEETVLANYRVNEGKGMMLWGNLNYAYGQNTMGFSAGSDISWVYHGSRGWTAPRAVGYMESHDEEREMYRNLNFGNSSGSYTVKNFANAIQRMKTAATVFYTIPGPKMLWEFGELGYDYSINACQDGSVNNNCRLDPKPVRWDYLQDVNRKSLFDHVSDLMRLRATYDVFTTKGTAQFAASSSPFLQRITLKNSPYTSSPVDSTQMNVQVAAFFDLTSQTVSINFPHDGTWYEYYRHNAPVTVSSGSITVTMNPGDYKIYTDVKIKTPQIEIENVTSTQNDGTYATGEVIDITISFSDVVNVTGTPQLILATSPNETANYLSGSGTNVLTFRYTVTGGDVSAHLDYLNANALILNGGTLKDAGGQNAKLELPAPGTLSSLGANKSIVISPLVIQNVSSTQPNGIYGTGQTVDIEVRFSGVVNVTNTPQLTMATTPNEVANYTFGSGTNTLTFNYIVLVGDVSSDLDYLNASALSLNGGTINDTGGYGATLTLPAPGSAGSLGFNKSIVISPITEIAGGVVEVAVYPNPTHGQLHVESDSEIGELQAKTITGTAMSVIRIDKTSWDLSMLSPGLYIIEVKTDQGVARKKIIKN